MSFILMQQLPDEHENGDNYKEVTCKNISSQSYFVGDIICRVIKKDLEITQVQFGKVLYPKFLSRKETLEDVLCQGFSGEFPVFWYDTQLEQVASTEDKNLFLVERQIEVGMVVRRLSLTSGNVISVDRVAAVRVLGTNKMISNVPVSKLLPLKHKAAKLGSYILHHEWLGVVTGIEYLAELEMSDASSCTFKWNEDMEQLFHPSNENCSLGERIKYPGQQLKLSKRDIMQVDWKSSVFEGKFRVFRSSTHSISTVIAIEASFTVQWLESLPREFHDRTPNPDTKLSSNQEFIVLDSIYKTDSFPIGKIYTLDYWGEKSWECQTYEEWLQTFSGNEASFQSFDSHESQDGSQMEQENTMEEVLNCGDVLNGHKSKGNCKKDALRIWNSLKSTNVESELYGKTLIIEVLCTQSWVTVRWPSFVKHIEYFASCEFEPMVFLENPIFKTGSVVKFKKSVGSQPSFLEYYGVVVQVDSRNGVMFTNWYKYLPGTKPCYVGNTKSTTEDVELHPEFGKLRSRSIVTWNEFWDFRPEVALGVVDQMGENGMFKIKTAKDELSCWPENLVKIPWIPFYHAQEGEWKLEKGDFQHCNVFQNVSARFDPSMENLCKWASMRGLLLNESGMGIEVIERIPNFMTFSNLPPVEIKDPNFFQEILLHLKLYTGNDRPGIWIKTFSDRKDLISVAMEGLRGTLYEDTLVFFSVKLPEDFPQSPPLFYFHSFSPQEINPCLKTNGVVLFPLLNTYKSIPGYHTEEWDPAESTLGLVLVCIRKLILCETPYTNHRNLEILKLFSTSLSKGVCLEKNLEYLEQTIESVRVQLESPLEVWREDLLEYYHLHLPKFYNKILGMLDSSSSSTFGIPMPSIPKERGEKLRRKLHYLLQVYQQTYH